MKYVLIDRYLELVRGEIGRAVKTITHGEELLDTESSPHPVLPASLVIEAQAQVAGILAACTMDFGGKSVLSKLDRAEFFRPVGPGDRLEITAKIEGTMEDARSRTFLITTRVDVDGDEVARMRFFLTALELCSDEGRAFDTAIFKREREDLFRTIGVLPLLSEEHRSFISSGF